MLLNHEFPFKGMVFSALREQSMLMRRSKGCGSLWGSILWSGMSPWCFIVFQELSVSLFIRCWIEILSSRLITMALIKLVGELLGALYDVHHLEG